MTLVALLFVLFFAVLVVCGLLVHVYLYSNGAFGEKIRRRSKLHFSTVSLRSALVRQQRSLLLPLLLTSTRASTRV